MKSIKIRLNIDSVKGNISIETCVKNEHHKNNEYSLYKKWHFNAKQRLHTFGIVKAEAFDLMVCFFDLGYKIEGIYIDNNK